MITFYMNLTRTTYKSTNTTISEPQVPYFTYTTPRSGISKINNLRFASSRALIIIRHAYYVCVHRKTENKRTTV